MNHLFPAFREKIEAAATAMQLFLNKHHPGLTWKLTDGFRSLSEQRRLFALGRTKPGKIVTPCDGVIKVSNHQWGMAADYTAFEGRNPRYDVPREVWAYWGHCVRAQGLKWGGDFKKPDLPHAEWPSIDKKAYQEARDWAKLQGLI